jgi:hypothetical protein
MRCLAAAGIAVVVATMVTMGRAEAATPSWAVQSTPSPGGFSELGGVSCPSTTDCMAVGSYFDSSSSQRETLADRWNGHSWAVLTTPPTGGAGIAEGLQAVSCPTTNSCIAVGGLDPGAGPPVLVAERWNGSQWTQLSITGPGGNAHGDLRAVSCPTANVCTAVGVTYATKFSGTPLAERWNGSRWTVQTTAPLPPNRGSVLTGVSCPTTTARVAVGTYGFVVAERWNGSNWTLQSIPHPTGIVASRFWGVSCSSAALCTAVGDMTNGSGVEMTRVERSNGTTWGLQPSPNPANATSSSLSGVSCPAPSDCTAIGTYTNSSGGYIGFAERWSGSAWVLQTVPAPTGGTHGTQLLDVFCSAATLCTAVGAANITTDSFAFAERYS